MTNVSGSASANIANGLSGQIYLQSIRLRYKDAAKFVIWPGCQPAKESSRQGFFSLTHPRKTRNLQEQTSYSKYGNAPVQLSQSTSAIPKPQSSGSTLWSKLSFRRDKQPKSSTSTPDVSANSSFNTPKAQKSQNFGFNQILEEDEAQMTHL